MPRATRPRVADQEPEEPSLQLVDPEDGQDDGADDEIEDLLSGLTGGGRLYATVYRVDHLGEKQWQPGRLVINPEEPSDALLERIYQAHGPGVYHLQVRAQGVKGTRGNAVVRIGGTPRPPEPSPPAAVQAPRQDTQVLDLLLKQNEQFLKAITDRAAPPAGPSAPTSIDGALDQLKKLFVVTRGLAREQATPQLPSWLNTLGEVAAPFLVTLATGLGVVGRKLQERSGQLPGPQPSPPAAGADTPSAPATGDQPQESPESLACKALVQAELKQPTPDADRLARAMWSVAHKDLGPLLQATPPGTLSAHLAAQEPALSGREGFARAVEDGLRRLMTPEPAPTPAAPTP